MKRISSNLNAIFKKIKNEEMFETETGSPIKLSGLAIKEKGAKKPIVYLANKFNQESWVDSISNFIEDPDFDAINNLFVILDDGNITPTLKPIGVLSKTTDFGSRGSSMKKLEIPSSTWGALSSLDGLEILKPGKEIEINWLAKFNKDFSSILMDNNLKSCDLQIGKTILKDVVGAMGAPGAAKDPKADVVFVDKNKNLIGFTSLKEGTSVTNFQQWGGLSKLKDPEITDFINRLKSYLDSKNLKGVPQGETIYSEIKSVSLKNKVAWGLEFAPKNFGIENVEFIMQGQPKVTEIKSGGKIKATLDVSHLITRDNNEIISATSPYRPIFCALFRNDRSDFGINKTRIFAYAYGGRKLHVDVTDFKVKGKK